MSASRISANQDSQVTSGGNPNQMDVTISAPVNTFFMRMFGITKITATRTSHAVYVLPVPMGSPLNYYGDFGKVRTPGGGTTTTTPHPAVLGPKSPTGTHTPNGWTNPTNAYIVGYQVRHEHHLSGEPAGVVHVQPARSTQRRDGRRDRARPSRVRRLPRSARCRPHLSWNAGAFNSWSSTDSVSGIGTTDENDGFGGPTDDMGSHVGRR